MKKKLRPPPKVERKLLLAREYLCEAFMEDESLGGFTVQLSDGHKLTLEELHTWLIQVIEHYEKNGPRELALKQLREMLSGQPCN